MDLAWTDAIKFAESENLISIEESMALKSDQRKEKAPYYWWIGMTLHLVDKLPLLKLWGEYHPAYKRKKEIK